MKVIIDKSEVRGRVSVPSSKSQTIRGLMYAALTKGESQIVNPLVCEDTSAAIDVLSKVGVRIQQEQGLWRVAGGTFRAPDTDLHCGESATTLRFMTAICSLVPGKCRLVGGPSLSRRPVRSLVEALKKLGVKCSIEGKTTPPVIVEGGILRGGLTELPGNISSQFISALLLIAPFAQNEVSIRLTTAMTSKPYVLMTLRGLRKFGINVRTEFDKFILRPQRYRPAKFTVEGDWSSASYFLALGAVSEGVEVENLNTASIQGDRVVLDLMRNMGAAVRIGSDAISRVAAVREGLDTMGVIVTEDRGRITVAGLSTKQPAADEEEEEDEEGEAGDEKAKDATMPEGEAVVINSRKDHRIAMAFGVLGAAVGGVAINGAECVSKTFPNFWDEMKKIGVKLKTDAE